MNTPEKTFTIIKTRKGIDSVTTATLEDLIKGYSNTLASGHSYNSKINVNPKTAKSLVIALNNCVSVLQKGSYDPNHYTLANN